MLVSVMIILKSGCDLGVVTKVNPLLYAPAEGWQITHRSPLSRMLNLLNRWKNLRRPTLLMKKSHPWKFPLRHLPCLNQTLIRLDIIILHEIVDHLTDSSDVVGNLDMYMYVPVSDITISFFVASFLRRNVMS